MRNKPWILYSEDELSNHKLFAYGILKRGFALDLAKEGAEFLGEARLECARLHMIHSGVGLRFSKDPLEVAHGELFLIKPDMWTWLDDIENNGVTYKRKLVDIWRSREDRGTGNNLQYRDQVWTYEHVLWSPSMYERLPICENGIYQ